MQTIQSKNERVSKIGPLSARTSSEFLFVRELTHRINNEYASAIGFVSLIAARTTDVEVKSALSQVTDLLHKYADVHRSLQMPATSTIVESSEYIRGLCQSIGRARLERRNIKLVLREFPFEIRSEQRWKLGMIIAELITNSMRHAFDERGGTILVEMSAAGSVAQCRVTDNGSFRGTPRPGQGLMIIDALTKELHGTIEHRFEEEGATSVLKFPINDDISLRLATQP